MMNNVQKFFKKHSSTILTVAGAVGVIGTSVLTAQATPKAMMLLENVKEEKGEELTPIEVVQVAWKPYIPAILSGASTIICIFGANYLNQRTQASLISAYAVLDNWYREYREKTKELYQGEAANVEHAMVKDKFDSDIIPGNEDEELFFDYESVRYFYSTLEKVQQAEHILNTMLARDGFACINDFYSILGLAPIEHGYQLGWSSYHSDMTYGQTNLLEFDYDKATMEDGLECTIITINYPSGIEYLN